MYRIMLKSKIHRATVTEADINYSGSITVDSELLAAADILEHEKVQVVNVTNGSRLETYTIAGEPGSGKIILNGAAARLMHQGDIVIILSYASVSDDEARSFQSKIVMVDGDNKIDTVSVYRADKDIC